MKLKAVKYLLLVGGGGVIGLLYSFVSRCTGGG